MRRQISNYRIDVFWRKPAIRETTNTKADAKQGKGYVWLMPLHDCITGEAILSFVRHFYCCLVLRG